MTMRSLLGALLLPLALAGCPDKPDSHPPDARTPTPAETRPPPPPHPDVQPPVPCQSDADCRSPACGPCTSGAPLRQNQPSCVVNPCPNTPVTCSKDKICVVK